MRFLLAFLLVAISAFGDQIRVGTLNAYLCFSPAVPHQGNIAASHPLTSEQYKQKVQNLASMIADCQLVGLQEVGGKSEVMDIAAALAWDWCFSAGKDTYTGEEVGLIYHLPGWKVSNNGRVSALDKVVSKHLLVTATKGTQTIKFLVVHLIRPIGKNAEKHQRQLEAVGMWAAGAAQSGVEVVVLGDTNDNGRTPGTSIFGPAKEANELLGWAPTHLNRQPYDRLVLFGPGAWAEAAIQKPPYGKKPNDLNRSLWTDHFALKALLSR